MSKKVKMEISGLNFLNKGIVNKFSGAETATNTSFSTKEKNKALPVFL
jgi:hypothetical protein